ncbi:MAG: hypothetical protein QOE37_1121 [Microbacteriaceae bacterium]|nr:hypothetical protein [Microbacteriaceae bacterium]
MQQRIVRTPDAASFLGLVPTLVGMQPEESLVLVVFRGKRTCGALRLDLPHLHGDVALKRFTNTVTGMVCRVQDADGLVPIVYTRAPFRAAPRALLRRVATRARTAGLDVKDVLIVARDAWASLLDPDAPPGGRPLAQITPTVLDGEPALLDAAAELRLPAVTVRDVGTFAGHVARWEGSADGVGAPVHGFDPSAGLRGRAFGRAAVPAKPFLERVVDGLDVGPVLEGMLESHEGPGPCPCLALLAVMARAPVLRDLAMLQFAWGPEFGAHVRDRTLLEPSEPLGVDEPVTLAFRGGDMPRPDQHRIGAALATVKLALAHVPLEERAPLSAMAGWLHWALGHGSIASAFADRAAAVDPGYPFARLLRAMLASATLPEWAFREEPLGEAGRAWLRPPA